MEWKDLVGNQPRDIRKALEREGMKGRYATITLSLATAETNVLKEIDGDYIGVASITGDGTCKVRLDHRHAQELDLRQVSEISSPFGKVYFTTDGAGGEVVLLIGGALTARIKPIQSKVSLRSIAGSDIDPVQDKRFKSHVFDHIDRRVLVTIDESDPISGTRAAPVSLKVRWAIINFDAADVMVGSVGVTNKAGAHGGSLIKDGGSLAVEHCDLKDIYYVNEDGVVKPFAAVIYIEEA